MVSHATIVASEGLFKQVLILIELEYGLPLRNAVVANEAQLS